MSRVMKHICDVIRWRYQFDYGKEWLNSGRIAVNSHERFLNHYKHFLRVFQVKWGWAKQLYKAAVSIAALHCARCLSNFAWKSWNALRYLSSRVRDKHSNANLPRWQLHPQTSMNDGIFVRFYKQLRLFKGKATYLDASLGLRFDSKHVFFIYLRVFQALIHMPSTYFFWNIEKHTSRKAANIPGDPRKCA